MIPESAERLSAPQWAVVESDLVMLTEDPQFGLSRRPPSELSTPERHALRVLQLLEGLDALDFGSRDQAVLDLLSVTPVEHCCEIEEALRAIEAHAMLEVLRRVHHLLRFTLDQPATAQRAAAIAQLTPLRRRLLQRICGDLLDQRVVYLLWRHLRAHGGALHRWRASPLPELPQPGVLRPALRERNAEVAQTTAQHTGENGVLSIWVLDADHSACGRLINAWCALRGDALLRVGKAMETRYFGRPWRGAHINDQLLLAAPGAWLPPLPDARTHPEALISQLTTLRRWALLPWPNTMHECAIALLTADDEIANEFSELRKTPEYQPVLLSSYRRVDSFEQQAGGAQFGERDQFGEIALLAGAADGCPPWLVLEFGAECGQWWRSAAAELQCRQLRRTESRGQPVVRAIYSGDKPAAWRHLWSRTGDDRNVAIAAVSGLVTPSAVLDCMDQIDACSGFRQAMWLSRQCGWGYMHMWGGGSDEHHAMFHAVDPQLTHRVYQYAASRVEHGWYLSGRW